MTAISPESRELHLAVRLAVAILLVPLVVMGAGMLLGAGLAPAARPAADFVQRVDEEVLDFPPLQEALERSDERSVVVDADGNELAILRAVNRVNVDFADIPVHVQNAVLATEDQTFWEHRGVNWRAIARAALGNLRAGEITSGASTITQQLVKNITERTETTIQRKLQEAVYAIELEQRFTKEQILEAYMNEAYLGNGVYGFGTAAEFYFSKSIGDLTIPEAALLAGLLRAPNTNEPLGNPENALERRNIVIQQMADAGFIQPFEVELYSSAPDGINPSPIEEAEDPFFVNYVRTLLRELPALGIDEADRESLVLRGGLRIETTLEPAIQRLADAAIREVLTDLDGPQSALTAVEPGTGRIIAIGFGPKEFGQGPGQTEVLPAVPGVGSSFGRQPGSSFKAFGLVAALEREVTPTYTVNTPSPYEPRRHCANVGWRPGNYSDGGGGAMNMIEATARSSNVYFAHLVDEFIGPEGLAETATRMGITSTDLHDPAVCAAILGAREVYPLDMASAFGTLANNGIHCEPYAIERILDRDGNVIYEGGGDCDQVVDPQIAAATTSLLRGPIEGGTASRNGRIGRPAAGKTGTTQDWRDAWFVGYIPQLSTAVWVGNEIPSTMIDDRCGRVTGGCLPTMIWASFMRQAIEAKGYPVQDFPPPPPFPSSIVPSVVGMTQEQAEAVLADAEYTSASQIVADFRPEGTVVEQSPVGGSEAPKGTQVLLSISDGSEEPPEPPDILGLSPEEAVALITELGLEHEIVEVPVDDEELYGVVVGVTVTEEGVVVVEVGRPRTEDDPPPPTPTASPTPSASPSEEPSPDPSGEPSGEPTDGASPQPTPTTTPTPTPAPSAPPPPQGPQAGPPGNDG